MFAVPYLVNGTPNSACKWAFFAINMVKNPGKFANWNIAKSSMSYFAALSHIGRSMGVVQNKTKLRNKLPLKYARCECSLKLPC